MSAMSATIERRRVYRGALGFFLLGAIAALAFAAGLAWSTQSRADDSAPAAKAGAKPAPKVIYRKNEKLDFSGMPIEGEVRNPGEFYFQHRNEEKFDSLVKRRKDFHREMLRDVVLSK